MEIIKPRNMPFISVFSDLWYVKRTQGHQLCDNMALIYQESAEQIPSFAYAMVITPIKLHSWMQLIINNCYNCFQIFLSSPSSLSLISSCSFILRYIYVPPIMDSCILKFISDFN